MKARGFAPLVLACGMLTGSATAGQCATYDDFNSGISAYNRHDWDDSIAFFDKAVAAGDLTPDQQYVAHMDRGAAHAAKGDRDAAVADYSACVGQRTRDDTPLLRRAALYSDLGKLDLAAQDLDAAIAAVPDDAAAHLTRAVVYEITGRPDKELADVEAAAPLSPDNNSIGFRIGIAQMQLGQFAEASATFEKLRNDFPAYGWIWLAFSDLKAGVAVPSVSLNYLHGAPWPDVIVEFFRGKSTENDVMKEAGNQQLLLCEANFYLGEWRLVHGDKPGAAPFLSKAAQSCPTTDVERYAAIVELGK